MHFRLSPATLSLRSVALCALLLVASPVLASHYHHGPTAGRHKGKHAASARAARSTHPRAIDDARATEIQTSLVKAGYLPSVSGHWDEASAEAMRKMQGDNGWQTKLIPDSRALIKLGLGPNTERPAAAAATSATATPVTASASSHDEANHPQ